MRLSVLLTFVWASVLWAAPAARATDFVFELVADDATAVPSGTGVFSSFGLPAIGAHDVAFEAFGSAGERGIYAEIDGALIRVADLATAIPGGSGNFTGFGPPCVNAGHVAFEAVGPSAQAGIYDFLSNVLDVVADKSMAIPGGVSNFVSFGEPACFPDSVAFTATGSFGFRAILSDYSGSLESIENNSGGYSVFGEVATAGPWLAATATGDSAGQVYVLRGQASPLTELVSDATPIPKGTGNFTGFEDASQSGPVAFVGTGSSGQRGIYVHPGTPNEAPELIADLGGTFTALDTPSMRGSWVAFLGEAGGDMGLYLHHDGVIEKVIAEGDPLGGSTVLFLGASRFSLDRTRELRLVFRVTLANGTRGVWVAKSPPLPAPGLPGAWYGLLGLALPIAVAAMLRRLSPAT